MLRRSCLAVLMGIAAPLFAQDAPPLPTIIAHRGASGDAPENTLAAFRLAFDQAADGIEGDFYLTKDGHIIALHDADTKRTAGGVALKPHESTLEELRRLDVGAWKGEKFQGEKMPTLQEVFAAIPPDKEFFLEVKSGPEIVPKLVEAIKAAPVALEKITVICFKEPVLAALKQALPEARSYWLVSLKDDPEKKGAFKPSLDSVLATLKTLGIAGVGFSGHDHVDKAFVEAIKKNGYAASVWTIDDPAKARRFRSLGVDFITTNYPQTIREELIK